MIHNYLLLLIGNGALVCLLFNSISVASLRGARITLTD